MTRCIPSLLLALLLGLNVGASGLWPHGIEADPPLPTQTAELAGTWTGVMVMRGEDLPLRMKLTRSAAGALEGEYQAGDRAPERLRKVRLEGRALTLEAEQDRFAGELSEDGNRVLGTVTWAPIPRTPLRFVLKRQLAVAAKAAFSLREHYTKLEARIPMRDGVKLYTAVYLPKDATAAHPVLLQRTPYSAGPYGPDAFIAASGPLEGYARDGYILAFQDVRGRYQSEGTFMHVRPIGDGRAVDETTDTWDTIDWLVKNIPHNNGRVGMHGISYPGFYAAVGLVRSHPALKAVSPQAPIMDWFIGDDDHRNGALCLDMLEFYAGFFGQETNSLLTERGGRLDMGTPDGYRYYLELGPVKNLPSRDVRNQSPFLREVLAHPTYDAFWQARNVRPHLKGVTPAVLTVGGWYDGEDMFGALECFKSIERQSPQTDNHLVMGPWSHGQWARSTGETLGQGDWGQATSLHYQARVEKPFFDQHLLGRAATVPKATVFEGGTHRWRTYDAWPPPATRTVAFFLQAGGKLSSATPTDAGFEEFVSDPARPVPYKNDIGTYHTASYLVDDQRFAATRPDVLVYESAPLDEDLTVAGPVRADLLVSTSGTDSDWVVKLIDVHPGTEADPIPNPKGYRNGHWQELVRGDVMRGKFRNSHEHPEPFVPAQPTRVAWALNDTLHTFRKGHRIMVQVQCSWFPLVDRNPQTFVDINQASEHDFVKATQRVHRSSRVELQVLPAPR